VSIAAIPLPPSPVPTPQPSESPQTTSSELDRGDMDASTPKPLNKAMSRSLSLSQRVQNMHEGNPAYHDPPDGQTGGSIGLGGGIEVEAEAVPLVEIKEKLNVGPTLKKKTTGSIGGPQGARSTASLRGQNGSTAANEHRPRPAKGKRM
jgi:hypothetical protein